MPCYQRWENMLVDLTQVKHIFIVYGNSDMRKGIGGSIENGILYKNIDDIVNNLNIIL